MTPKSAEVDLESQNVGQSSKAVSDNPGPLSPLGRLSWNRSERTRRGKQTSSDSGAKAGNVDGEPTTPLSPTGATLFNTQDRPDFQMMESYAVVSPNKLEYRFGRSQTDRSGKLSDGAAGVTRESSTNNRGLALFKSPTMLIQPRRSRSRRRGSKEDTKLQTAEKAETVAGVRGGGSTDMISSPISADQDAVRVDVRGELPSDVRRLSIDEEQQPETAATAANTLPDRTKQRLSEFHAQYPHLKKLPKPLLPIVAFPGQGAGRLSEFAQDAPIWAQQPYKILYFAYFGLSVGLVFLPWFAIVSAFPSKRERKSWTWKKSTLVKLYRHGTRLTFRTHTSLSRDLTKEVPHSKTVRAKFVWVEALPQELVRGELKRALAIQSLSCVRTCGFWYGERDGGGGVGQKAAPGEKVVYHLHGGAYWIGTAHEKDVTAAVNVQVLKALDKVYTSRLPNKQSDGRQSPHPGDGKPSSGNGGLCKRAFSLDYRLCVPGRPEVGSFPAPLADALAGYRYLVHECAFDPKNIIVAGDSAGGNLALALCRYIRDEKIDELPMPGAMLLLSPWTDTSRSHSGPTSAPNELSTVYVNRNSDIIASSAAFRNTAVSALLGKMPARETYKNPYLSAISLQLASKDGGAGPNWGFEGFPKSIYVCTGTAEISHDQHLTLAYRLASGTKKRIPILVGDKCSQDADPYELAARLQYPRPEDHEVTLWPSAQNTPAGLVMTPFYDQWEGMNSAATSSARRKSSKPNSSSRPPSSRKKGKESGRSSAAGQADVTEETNEKGIAGTALEAATNALDAVSLRLKGADGYFPGIATNLRKAVVGGDKSETGSKRDSQNVSKAVSEGRVSYDGQAGEGDNTTAHVKEKDTAHDGHATHAEDRRENSTSQVGDAETRLQRRKRSLQLQDLHDTSLNDRQDPSSSMNLAKAVDDASEGRLSDGEEYAGAEVQVETKEPRTSHGGEVQGSYFDIGGEDRTVVLDECRDGIHDYTLFDWFEPERGRTWARIAEWIDEETG